MNTSTGLLELNGAALRFEMSRPAPTDSAAVVSFLQGISVKSTVWKPQISAFSRRYQLLRCDLLEENEDSRKSREPRDLALDFITLMDHLDISSSFIVGCCQGSTIALDLARRFPERVRAVAAVIGPCADEGLDGTATLITAGPLPSGRLNEILAPVLLITGEQDTKSVQDRAAALANGIARSRRRLIPDCGSLPNVNAPSRFNEALQAFLLDNTVYTDMM